MIGAEEVAALALEFQVAQKLHACTDPPQATQAGLADTLEVAVAELNSWVVQITRS